LLLAEDRTVASVRVAAVGEIPEDTGKLVAVAGVKVALFRAGDQYFALADTCSHDLASLSDGDVIGRQVECPLHGARFDLATGKPRTLPAVKPVAVYAVEIRDGGVWLTPPD
jgi:3-phenylpropionate/trans-cinnamate dioxygenase ferredoxin subunit